MRTKMSDDVVQGGTDGEVYPLRKRIGKLLFFIGLVLVVSGITLSLIIGTVDAYSGTYVLTTTYSIYLGYTEIFGALVGVIGLIAWVLPYGVQSDGLWILKTGPYSR